MKILLHICCGPCAIYPADILRGEGHELHGYFYNPNIHPFQEFKRRRETLAAWAEAVGLPITDREDYDLEGFLRKVVHREDTRCEACYALRLSETAAEAARGGFEAITTTLLYSRYQKHDRIVEIGRAAAEKAGIDFVYRDFRIGWREGIERSKALGMYRQPYCGCVYSEKERYFKPKKGNDSEKEPK